MSSPTPTPPDQLRALVGVADIADLLGVSRQRADALSRSKRFPDPVALVLPLDPVTFDAMRQLFAEMGGAVDVEQAIELIEGRGFALPEHPRLWRISAVVDWAEAAGRELHRDEGKVPRA